MVPEAPKNDHIVAKMEPKGAEIDQKTLKNVLPRGGPRGQHDRNDKNDRNDSFSWPPGPGLEIKD